jgi:hypothetical protein
MLAKAEMKGIGCERWIMKRITFILFFVAFCIVGLPSVMAHRYHTSVTRMEYNGQDKDVEITIQTFVNDVEDILSKRAGVRVQLDGGKDAEQKVYDYLRSSLEIQNPAVKSELQWVGMEVKGESLWVYATAQMPKGIAHTSVRNTFLFDLFNDQVNIVNVISEGKKTGLVLKGDVRCQMLDIGKDGRLTAESCH